MAGNHENLFQGCLLKQLMVMGGVLLTLPRPFRKIRQLDVQSGSLHRIQATVDANKLVIVAGMHPVAP